MRVQDLRDISAAPSRAQRLAHQEQLRRAVSREERRLHRLAGDLDAAGLRGAALLVKAALLNVQASGRALLPDRRVGSEELVQRAVDGARAARSRDGL